LEGVDAGATEAIYSLVLLTERRRRRRRRRRGSRRGRGRAGTTLDGKRRKCKINESIL